MKVCHISTARDYVNLYRPQHEPCDAPGGCDCHVFHEWRRVLASADVAWLVRAASIVNAAPELDGTGARHIMADVLVAPRVRVGARP
jgi:hypothetical protein